jgi:hypothetical protein
MMTKPNIQIDNLVREMTDDEYHSFIFEQEEQKLLIKEQEAKIAARESALAKLAKLGLTQAEIDAL